MYVNDFFEKESDRCYLNPFVWIRHQYFSCTYLKVIKQEQSGNQKKKYREKLQYNNVQFFNLCHSTLLLYSCVLCKYMHKVNSVRHFNNSNINNATCMHLIEAGKGNFVQVNGGYVTRRIAFVLDRPIIYNKKHVPDYFLI